MDEEDDYQPKTESEEEDAKFHFHEGMQACDTYA